MQRRLSKRLMLSDGSSGTFHKVMFNCLKPIKDEYCKCGHDEPSLQNKSKIVGNEPGDDDLTKRSGSDSRADGSRCKADHNGKSDTRQNNRHGKGNLDFHEPLRAGHPHAACSFDNRRRQSR
ncbi:hypothetical protein D3C80_1794270 [compost metagenome]